MREGEREREALKKLHGGQQQQAADSNTPCYFLTHVPTGKSVCALGIHGKHLSPRVHHLGPVSITTPWSAKWLRCYYFSSQRAGVARTCVHVCVRGWAGGWSSQQEGGRRALWCLNVRGWNLWSENVEGAATPRVWDGAPLPPPIITQLLLRSPTSLLSRGETWREEGAVGMIGEGKKIGRGPSEQLGGGGDGSIWSLDSKGTAVAFGNRCRTSSKINTVGGVQ